MKNIIILFKTKECAKLFLNNITIDGCSLDHFDNIVYCKINEKETVSANMTAKNYILYN